ncbi:MAG: hypothetical protein FJ388_11165, partial [Verrucomicrobia bacterium]|nr:hypothetical protein [Verrucomicrobiota bacterium]
MASAHADELDQLLALARKTLDFVQRSRPLPALAARLQELERRATARDADRAELSQSARQLRRQIIFSHPLLDFDRLLINKCPTPSYSHQSRQYLGRYSRPGPGLAVIENWKEQPRETLLFRGRLPVGSTMHPELSFDARRVVFAFCEHTPADSNLRQFFLWEIGADGRGLRQLTGRAADRANGEDGRQTALVEDFDPCYLPDGGIAFISTRPQTHIRCQYGGRYFANFLLYRCDADGRNIRQLSFAEAPEWEPSLLDDGRIVYSRWDYTNRHSYHFQSIWVTHPDGTGTASLYGNLTRNPCNSAEPRQIPGSHKIACTAAAHHAYTAGSIIVVDPRAGLDGLEPVTRVTPEVAFPETEGWPTSAFTTPWPLSEDLFLAAYTPEPLAKEGKVQSANAYGIYLVDTLGGRELIYRDPQVSCMSPMPLVPRPKPPVLPSALPAAAEPTGTFYIQNVYQSSQPIAPGSIAAVRVVRVFPQTVETPPGRSISVYEMPKRILGTAPVDANGSAAFRAPAGQPLFFQLVDKDGMAVMTMRALAYLQPGEEAGCIGCHESRHGAPERASRHARARIYDLQPPAGPRYEGGLSFAKTVQPVLDRYCIACHGLERTDGGVNLLGTLRPVTFPRAQWPGPNKMRVSIAYESLMTRTGLVAVAQGDMETDFSKPKDYFAHAGRLAPMLLTGHPDKDGQPRVRLERESFARIADWLDMNAVCYGNYSWNKPEWREPSPDGERALREHVRARFGAAFAEAPFAALVNVALPEESRVLKAPLAAAAAGWGQIPENGWRDTSDPDYVATRRLVEAAIGPLLGHDIAGTCGRDNQC